MALNLQFRSFVWAFALSLIQPIQTIAQETVTPEFALPLDFAPPGARSTSLGRAFIGLADDATAASANPAGLVKLPRPEVSHHLRVTSAETFSREFFPGNGLRLSSGTATVPAFVSVVFPVKPNRFAVSAFYAQEVNARNVFEQTVNFSVPANQIGQRTARQSNDLVVAQLGVAAAYALGRRFAIGVGVRSSRASLDFSEDISFYDDGLGRGQSFTSRRIDSQSTKPTWTLGGTAQVASALSAGAVYRRGAQFSLDGTETFLFGASTRFPTAATVVNRYVQTVTIPDSYGLGVALRPPQGAFTATFDLVRVEYSDMLASFPSERLDDATELHAGFEYRQPIATHLLALRLGAYSDRGHHPFEGQRMVITAGQGFETLKTSQVFATGGVGLVVSRVVQLDVAFRQSKYVAEIAVSTVVRF